MLGLIKIHRITEVFHQRMTLTSQKAVDIVIEHLGATLSELGVGPEDIKQVAAIANSVRDAVLGCS